MNTFCFLKLYRYMEKGRSDQFLSLSDPCPWVWELHTKDDLIAVSVKFLTCFTLKSISLFWLWTNLLPTHDFVTCKTGCANIGSLPLSWCAVRHSSFTPGRKITWRRECLPTPVFLSGESLKERNLRGYSPLGLQRVRHKSGLGKRFIESQDRLVDFNVTECQIFSDRASDSMLKLSFRKLPLVDS